MGLVAEGLRPARDNDTLELDECWTYVRQRSNKRWLWVALCRRTRQVVANAHGDRSARTCARLWSRIQQSDSSRATGRAGASATSGSPPKRQLLPVFEEDPTHRQVGKSSGELACAQAFLRAPAAETGQIRQTDASGLPVRTNGSPDDKAVRGVVQRSRHLTSTCYPLFNRHNSV